MTKTPTAKANPIVISNAKLTRIHRDGAFHPAVSYAGEAPSKGDTLRLRLGGVIYTGTVQDAIAIDSDVLVEFQCGLTPVQ